MLTALVALALGTTAFAQYGHGRYGGPGYGSGYGTGFGHGPRYGYFQDSSFEFGITLNHFGSEAYRPDRVGFFGEYRVDLGPFVDMGLQLSTTFGKGSLDYTGHSSSYSPDMWYWQGAPLVVTDVNLLPYTGFNPYLGIGIGPGFGFEKNNGTSSGEWTQALVLSPRAGVELFDCLRMSVQYQWYLNDSAKYSHVAFGISWAFPSGGGGRPRYRR